MTAAATEVTSPESWETPQDGGGDPEMYMPAVDESGWFGADTAMLLDSLDELGATALSKPAARPLKRGASISCQGHGDPWSAAHGGNFFDFPLTEEGPAPDRIPTPLQLLDGADSSLGIMYTGQNTNDDMLGVDFLDSSGTSMQPVQSPSAASSLMRFGERMERRMSAMSAFVTDSRHIVEDCGGNSMDMGSESPVAVAIMCTKEFTDIIQNLKASARSSPSPSSGYSNQPISLTPTSSSLAQSESLSTETTLLILSSYLQLMRLYDSLFHDAHQSLSKIPAETIKTLKVKAVLRIGGVSSPQDMPGKLYAKGVIEVIQSHIQTLERCMGLPAAYCLSGDGVPMTPKGGIFADVDRARLLHAVMAQEDVGSLRGKRSYVESIRENIKNSVALFGDW